MPVLGVPICIECGTSNPCRCKVVRPTVGFVAFAVVEWPTVGFVAFAVVVRPTVGFVAFAVVEWPVGLLVYPFMHTKGRKIMGHPAAVVYPTVSNAIPI